jgi:hypothetical protein
MTLWNTTARIQKKLKKAIKLERGLPPGLILLHKKRPSKMTGLGLGVFITLRVRKK